MAIKVVTDSTSDLPKQIAESMGITVVPLNVHFGDEVFKDGVDLLAADFYERLTRCPDLPRTSQPSPGDFAETYESLLKDADAIVSVHISSKLSGTYNSAVQAQKQADTGGRIEVVDSHQASMGLGMTAMAAARAASGGATVEEVVEAANDASGRSQCFPMLDTLEYLQKGGRIGRARAMFGTLLKIKPMIIIRDGEVHELGKERTFAKGIARIEQVARGFAPIDELCVLYSTDQDAAERLAGSLRDLLPDGKAPLMARFGPVIGTYVGPGAVGIGLLRAQDAG